MELEDVICERVLLLVINALEFRFVYNNDTCAPGGRENPKIC